MAVEVDSGAYMNQADGDFSHNPLHDLESLWWVILLCHYKPSRFQDITVQQQPRTSTTTMNVHLNASVNHHLTSSPQATMTCSIVTQSRHLTTCLEPHISHRHLRPG